jgi:hypothetical protein
MDKWTIALYAGVLILVVFIVWYYASKDGRNINFMKNLYSLNGYILPINDEEYKHCLRDYYVKTAFNACSGGELKNDFVNIEVLKSVIQQGVRCLDFEIYSIDDKPVVATSTTDELYIKETYNSVPFAEVLSVIDNYAFAPEHANNYSDPLILHLRIKSDNAAMIQALGNQIAGLDKMLGLDYSYASMNVCATDTTDVTCCNVDDNIAKAPLYKLKNKIILITDREFADEKMKEYTNMISNSHCMRLQRFYDVKNTTDMVELINYNRLGLSFVIPDKSGPNPSGQLAREMGCQMVAMQFQKVDNFLIFDAGFFDEHQSAFVRKPEALCYIQEYTEELPPQDPKLSYETRNVSTDYYSFDF